MGTNIRHQKSLKLWNLKTKSVFLVAFLGVLISVLMLITLLSNQQRFLKTNFKLDTNRRIYALQKEVENTTSVVKALKAFYEGSERVERYEFEKFSKELLRGKEQIETLLWVPRVPRNWRKAYENAAVNDGLKGFSFRVLKEDNTLEISEEKDSYYPAYFVQPKNHHEDMLGLDLSFIEELNPVFEKAKLSGDIATSTWTSLVEKGKPSTFQIIVVNPIYRDQGKSNLAENEFLGFVVAILKVDRLFDTALNMFTPKGLDIYFSEWTSDTPKREFYHYDGTKKQGSYSKSIHPFRGSIALNVEEQIWIADKPWSVHLSATPHYFTSRYLWMPWAVFFVGLLITYLLSAFVNSVLRSKKSLQRLNYALKEEVNERRKIAKLVSLNEIRLRQIMDLVPHMIYAKDGEGKFLIANKLTAEVYDTSVDELIGKRQIDVHFNKEQAKKYDERDHYVLKNQKMITINEEEFEKQNGEIQILQTTKMPFAWDDEVGDVVLAISIDITDAKKTEELRISEERFRGLVEKSHDAIFLIRSNGTFVDANQKASEIFGYGREELFEKKLFDIDFGQTESKFKKLWEDLKKGICITKESFCRRKDKRFFPVEMRLSLITIRDEEFVLLNLRDISKLKNMNRKLKESNTFLDSIIENIPNMIFIKSAADLKFIRLNKKGEKVLGITEAELIGKDDYDFFPKEEADFFVAKDRLVLEEGKLLDIPDEIVHTKGSGIRYLHTKKMPIYNELGEPAYLLGISEDITEQKMAQLDLEQLHLAMENALDGIAKLSGEGIIVHSNKSLNTLLGIRDETMNEKNWRDFIHLQDQSQMKVLFEQASKNQKAEGEVRAVKNDRSIFHAQVVIIRNDNPFDSGCEYYCFIKDVSEKKYRQSIEHKSELISMVSHELRTPIHSVREGVSVMLDGLTGEVNEQQREILATNLQSLDRLARLVNSFLDFQRLEAGVVEFEIQSCDMNALVLQAIREITPLAKHKDLEVISTLEKELPKVDCDSDRIMQVFMNLLANAVKFTSEGEIRVETRSMGNVVEIIVDDTGVGIHKDDIPRLFKKFGQLESGKLLAPAGTGLGLAISKKIVDAHQGLLNVESQYQIGSKFIVQLPVNIKTKKDILEEAS